MKTRLTTLLVRHGERLLLAAYGVGLVAFALAGLSRATRLSDAICGLLLIGVVAMPGHRNDWIRGVIAALSGGFLLCTSLVLKPSDAGFLVDTLVGAFVVMQACGMRWRGPALRTVRLKR